MPYLYQLYHLQGSTVTCDMSTYPDSEDDCLFKFLSEKVIRVTPQIEAHLTFLRGLDKRDDIEVNK